MPVKPVLTFTFSTNLNYSAGPFIGSVTKVVPGDIPNGMVPGTGIVAEWANYLFGNTGDWITDWVNLGTSAADLDAHIVETNSFGTADIAALALGGTASSTGPLFVNENSGFAAQAASFKHSTGIAALFTSASPVNGTILADNTGTGPAVHATASGADNVGVEANGNGTGAGGDFVGGATGSGIVASGGATSGRGGVFTGVSASVGVQGTGGASGGVGVLGIAASNNFGGVEGLTTGASGVTANAVRGLVLGGSGNGVKGDTSAGDGYAVFALADPTSPVSAAFRMAPQDDDPSVGAEGDLMYNSTTDEFRGYQATRWQSLVAEQNGYARAVTTLGTATNNNSAAYTQLVSATLATPYSPKHLGSVFIQASAEFGADGGSVHTTIDVRIRDTTSGATVWSQTIDHPAAVAGPIYDRPWSIMVPYSVPAIGTRNWHLEFKKSGGAGSGISARDASLYIHGVY